jgi:hypothetical protein
MLSFGNLARMQNLKLPIVLLILVLTGMLALASLFLAFRLRPIKQSYPALAAAILPALLMLALFLFAGHSCAPFSRGLADIHRRPRFPAGVESA